MPPNQRPQPDGGASQADNALLVKQALHQLEDAIEKVQLPSSQKGVTREGNFVYGLLGLAGITCDNAQVRPHVERERGKAGGGAKRGKSPLTVCTRGEKANLFANRLTRCF